MTRVERRTTERVEFAEDVVVFAKGRRITCRGTDLSEGGIGLEPPAKARPGLHLIVDVDLDGGQTVAIEGYVVREQRGGQYRWGVRFHDVPPRVQRLLAAFVQRERRRQGAEKEAFSPSPQAAPRDLPERPWPAPPAPPAPAPPPPVSRPAANPMSAAGRQEQPRRAAPARAAASPRPRGSGAAPLPTPAAPRPDVLDRINTAEQMDLRQVQQADLERDLEDALSKLYEQALDAIDDPLQ